MKHPLGEFPDLPARSGVYAVMAAAERVHNRVLEAATINDDRERLAKIAELHWTETIGGQQFCDHCGVLAPCDTMRIIEAVPL